MSKKQIIALVACVSVFALLCAVAIVGSATMLLLGNTQGLIGELLSDAELLPRRAQLQLTAQALHKHFGFACRQLRRRQSRPAEARPPHARQ